MCMYGSANLENSSSVNEDFTSFNLFAYRKRSNLRKLEEFYQKMSLMKYYHRGYLKGKFLSPSIKDLKSDIDEFVFLVYFLK